MDRAGITPLKQQWLDASKKLADLQDKQRADVENTEKLKAAIAIADDARSTVQQARAAISGAAVSSEINQRRTCARPGLFMPIFRNRLCGQ